MHTRSIAWVMLVSFLSIPASRVGAENRLFIEDQTAHLGQTGMAVPVRLDSDQEAYGFSLSMLTDPQVLKIVGMDVLGTAAEGAEFSAGQIHDEGARIHWGVVLDISAPFDPDNVLPPGAGLTIATLLLDVTARDEASATLRFENIPSTPVAKNVLVGPEGVPLPLALSPGTITVAKRGRRAFLRGDADDDGRLNTADAVYSLEYLFTGGLPPACKDAADANDNGELDLADAVASLTFLFVGGKSLPDPCGACGIDPTLDDLDCESHSACR